MVLWDNVKYLSRNLPPKIPKDKATTIPEKSHMKILIAAEYKFYIVFVGRTNVYPTKQSKEK